eukprot:765802-Hanusia_phi.AAC.11
MSPMAHVSNVSGPVLLLVGGDDRRVECPRFRARSIISRSRSEELTWRCEDEAEGKEELRGGRGGGGREGSEAGCGEGVWTQAILQVMVSQTHSWPCGNP